MVALLPIDPAATARSVDLVQPIDSPWKAAVALIAREKVSSEKHHSCSATGTRLTSPACFPFLETCHDVV
jgi:hypothetical protein